ncbi:MAG: restriction endonuclease subunit S [Enterococcus sp.]|nr:restriction endonuclease subunit S [Enterococcus sp.]
MNEKEKLIPQRRFKEFKNTGTWEQRKLGDVVKNIGTGNSKFQIQEKSSDASYAILGSTSVIGYDNNFDFEGNFVLTARVGANAGTLYQHSGKVKISDNTVYIQSDNLSFLYNLLNRFDLKKLSFGTGQPLVKSSELKKLALNFPNKEEQEKIGNFFYQLDDTIALHQRKLEKTKALKSAYLSELFPVEGERKPKRRFAGFIDDWKQGTVGEYGYFYYGKSAPKWSVTKDAIIPCVRYGELYTKFGAKIDKVYSYTNISKENLKFSTGNEVLVPRVGEDPLDFANCSWLSIPNVAIGEMISVYNTEENPLFISYYFNSQLRHAFAKRVEGGNVSNLYFTYLENITISIPNKEEQDTIANFLESLDSVVEHHQHKLEKLKNIKQAYLNELFV